MAYELKCKHCGRLEEEHRRCAGSRCETMPHLRGYKKRVANCLGYELRISDQAKARMNFEMECLERRAAERYAWGAHSAQVRQTVLDGRLRSCKNQKERDDILNEARRKNSGGMYIG